MSQGPWSVKGIAPEARSLARERAQRRGVTLGQYLNTLLLDDAPVGEAGAAAVLPRSVMVDAERPEDLRDLSEEIDRLAARMEQSQGRSSRALAGVDKSILTLSGKLDESNKAQLGALERLSRVVVGIEGAQTTLRDRIGSLEHDLAAGATVEALKALEASLERLSETVNQRSTALAQDQLELRDLFEDRVISVSDKVDSYARSVSDKVDHHARSVEERVDHHARIVDEKVDHHARSVDEKVDSLSRAFDQTIDMAVRTSTLPLIDRVGQVETHISAVDRKMESALGRITEAAQRFEMFESKAERAVSDTTWRMERALETSVQRSRALTKDLSDRLDTVEERTRGAVDALGSSVARVIDRLERSERSTEQAVKTIERSVVTLDERIGRMGATLEQDSTRMQADLHHKMEVLAQDLARPIQTIRRDFEQKLEQAMVAAASPEALRRLEETLGSLHARLEASESRQADVVEAISSQVQRLSEAVNHRIESIDRGDSRALNDLRGELGSMAQHFSERADDSDRRNSAALDKLNGQIGAVADSLNTQISTVADSLKRQTHDSIDALSKRMDAASAGVNGDEFETFVERIDDRVRSSERRSATAIEQIGEQVARVAERLQNQQRETLRSIEDRVEEAGRVHEARLADTLSDVMRRMDDIGETSASSLNPIRNTLSSIAMRLSAIEDRDTPGPTAFHDDAYRPAPVHERSMAPPPVAEMEDFSDFLAAARANAAADPLADAFEDEIDASSSSDIFDTEESIIGVEPPPFERGPAPDLGVFEDEDFAPPSHEAARATQAAPVAPVVELEDLLDVDDELLEPVRHANYVASVPNAPLADGPLAAEARQAARFGRDIRLSTQSDSLLRRGLGKGPLVASAALAIAVAGGGGYAVWRGKQDTTNDTPKREDPAAPMIAEGDPAAAAAALFDEHDAPAGAHTATTEAAAAPATAVATAAHEFEATSLVSAEAKAQAAAKPAAKADAKPATPAAAARAPSLMDAVRDGNPIALHDYAVELLKGPEKSRAVSLLKEAASKGLVMAQYRVAKLYERGEGVPRDMAASRKWAEQAAIGGNVKAMHDLAVFYAEGDAGPQSYAAAVEWFRQAADHGLVDSQYNLAVLYEQGLGVSEDKAEAAFWFEIAAKNGDQDAGRRSRALLSSIDPAKAEETRRRARTFNAKPGDRKANGDLGKRAWDAAPAN